MRLRFPRGRMALEPVPGARRPLFGGRIEAAVWARGTRARARCRWEAGVGAGLSLWSAWGSPGPGAAWAGGEPGFPEAVLVLGDQGGLPRDAGSWPLTRATGLQTACLLRSALLSLGTVGSGPCGRQSGDAAFVNPPYPNWRETCYWPG